MRALITPLVHFRPRGNPHWWQEERTQPSAAARDWRSRHAVAMAAEAAQLARRNSSRVAIQRAHDALVLEATRREAREQDQEAEEQAWKQRVEL